MHCRVVKQIRFSSFSFDVSMRTEERQVNGSLNLKNAVLKIPYTCRKDENTSDCSLYYLVPAS